MRYEFPQLHNSRSKWLHASQARTLIFIWSCTPKFNSLHKKLSLCSRWALCYLPPDSSPFWGLPAAATPWYFTSCLQSVWITAQVTVTALQQEWEGRNRVTVQLTAQKNKGHSGTRQMNSLGDGYFPSCAAVLSETMVMGWVRAFLRSYAKIINGYWNLTHWRKH